MGFESWRSTVVVVHRCRHVDPVLLLFSTFLPMALAQHRLRVMRLYRGALKNALNWAIERELFYEYAKEIRGKFEENLRITDLREAQRVLVAGEKYLQERIHPDPWTRMLRLLL